VTHVTNALLAVVLAPGCAACARVLERPLDGPICNQCWTAVRLLTPLAFHTTVIESGRSAGDYDGALKEIIHAFKYEGRRSLAAPLGALMRDAGRHLMDQASCAVPVPLHPWRRMQRGFNQAADLASTLNVPVIHALWRRRFTPAQTGLTASARRRNVREAFRVSPFMSERTASSMVVDRVVVLVDDVMTTGATLDACARVLAGAGAREVRALTVARAEPPAGTRDTGFGIRTNPQSPIPNPGFSDPQ
jgi:ComF family protein